MSEHGQTARKKPVDFDELYPGRFLKAGLFRERPVTLRIRDVDTEPLPNDKGGERVRGILSFDKTEMQLVLNRTNGLCLRAMFGARVADWIGKRVTFACEQDKFGRDTVDAIRIVGSPDIAGPVEVQIVMPKKAPKVRRLVVTGAGPATVAAPSREPGEDGEALGHG